MRSRAQPEVLGWREWVSLPELGVDHIKAKIDTGARTSALHAFFVDPFLRRGRRWVRIGIHPLQGSAELAVEAELPVVDHRGVTDSGGHREMRYVVRTDVVLGAARWPIELTLTNRDTMKFRMLLGRTALKGRYVVDPRLSYRIGKAPASVSGDKSLRVKK
jgi:hypothetical protein